MRWLENVWLSGILTITLLSKKFYEALVIDVEIIVIEINKEIVYFKSRQPTTYVEQKVAEFDFTFVEFEKGILI